MEPHSPLENLSSRQMLQLLQHLMAPQDALPRKPEDLERWLLQDARAVVLLEETGQILFSNPAFQQDQARPLPSHWARCRLGGFKWQVHELTGQPARILQLGLPLAETSEEGRFRTYFSAMTDVVLVMDLQGRHLEIAPTRPQLFYRPSQEMLGKTMHELFPRAFADAFVFRLQEAMHQNQEIEFEYTLHIQDRDVWFGARVVPINAHALLVIARDITEKKQAELALRESERRFQFAADHAPVLIWMSGPDGGVQFFNQRWLEFRGRTLEQELGQGWMEGIHPEDRPSCLQVFEQNVQQHRSFEMEFRLRRSDGEHRWLVNRGMPRHNPEGQLVGFIGACIDIHDRKLAEATLLLSEQRLRTLSEAQKRFVADAAHELRTPLTSIQGNLDILLRYPQIDPEEKLDILTDAQREAVRLARLVNDMLQLARGDAGVDLRIETVNFGAVAGQAFREMQRLSRHQMLLQEVQALQVMGDTDRLKQVVLILLENALKYTPEGGTIRLSVQEDQGQALLVVSDTGIGIAQEDLPRVFERFYRVDQARQSTGDPGGTGLGLPIAQWIVQQHRGTIHLASELGKGSTVQVRLPLAP